MPLLPEDCHSRCALTNEEVKLLLKEAAKVRWDYRVLFLVAIYTGQRLGDCCCLKWDQINLEQNIIQLVPAKTRRTARGRLVTIPIHSHLRKILIMSQSWGWGPWFRCASARQAGPIYLRVA